MCAAERQRYQRGAGRQHGMTELSRQLIAEAARAHARNRQTAAGDDQRLGLHGADLVCRNVKAAIIILDLRNRASGFDPHANRGTRSAEHTSELQSLMRLSYAVFCLKKKTTKT